MKTILISVYKLLRGVFWQVAAIALVLSSFCALASAQGRADNGTTPLGMQPGSPAGSYALSGFETVNPYNGGLNFALPLLQVGGRGGAQYTMMLKRELKWKVNASPSPPFIYFPATSNWTAFDPGYGPGVMVGRVVGLPGLDSCPEEVTGLTRLTFITSDGTELEFRDAVSEGGPNLNTYVPDGAGGCNLSQTFNRGRVFITRDGSSATFISESDIFDSYPGQVEPAYVPNLRGHMFMADGTCYRIYDGLVQWIRDRNGNKLTFTYDPNVVFRVTSITDSLNRVVTISYGANFDTITYKGFGGLTRTIKVYYDFLENLLRTGFTQTYAQLFPGLGSSTISNTLFNPKLVSAVELPDLRTYEFRYNSYGELARVKLPTGGGFEYDWDAGVVDSPSGSVLVIGQGNRQVYRRVVERRVYTSFSGTPAWEGKMTYSRPEVYNNIPTNAAVVVNHYAPGDLLQSREWHYFYGTAHASFLQGDTSYPNWKDGKEYKTEIVDNDSNNTLLQRTETTFEQMPLSGFWWGNDSSVPSAPPINTRVKESKTTWTQTNQVAKQEFAYDQYNNRTEIKEYDFGSGTPGALKRRSTTSFLVINPINGVDYTTYNLSDAVNSVHIRRSPVQQSVYDVSDNEKARTTYEYDNYTLGLTLRSNASGHDSAKYHDSFFTRGNATQTTSHVLQTGEQFLTRLQYDILGNVTSSKDPRQKVTSFDFADAFGSPDTNARGNEFTPTQPTFALPTKVTNALGHTAYTQFDYWSGKPVNGEDANQVVSKGRYDDLLDRATELVVAVASPSGSALARRTRFVYSDAAKTITTYSDQTTLNDDTFKSEILYDGLGRTIKSQQYVPDSGGFIISEQRFDAMGRSSQSSNPYRIGDTVLWTTTTYDGMSRVKSVISPDNSVVTSSYNGNQTTVVDQALKQRRSTTDGLGRLTQVDELNLNATTYATTTYQYDVLDNLKQVNQGSQNPRTFVYDSLKRLTSATNPESGQVSYTYDENSNLLTKTDARVVASGPSAGQQVKVTYAYDDLNRVSSRTYNDNLTPSVTYTYDNLTNAIGKLTHVSNGVSSSDYLQFDALGRVKQSQQTTNADGSNRIYQMSYAYNLAGEMTSETYPSGKVVESEYDTVGRISGVKSQGNYYAGGAPNDAINRIRYTAHGAVSAMKLGNGRWEHTNFNNRLQPTQIGLGTSDIDSSILRLDYTYGTTNNNGNVATQQIQAPGLNVTQTYTYDQCNRLLTASESPTGSQTVSWKQTFTYDPFGNRNFDTDLTDTFPPQVLGANPTISQTNNRINAMQGYLYDAVGNVTQEPGNKSYTYDAENHQVSFTANSGLPNAATTQYVYDGDGRRVKRVDPNNTSLVFVYNASGQLIAEYATNTPTGAAQTSYLTMDHLGSTRVVMTKDASGAVVVRARYDFLPFGEELTVSRSGVGGYSGADTTRQKFTGHERDAESGLDFAQARYCSPMQGRFLSIDPTLESVNINDAQTWNRYAYVSNNPLRFVDPLGLWAIEVYGVYRTQEVEENGKKVTKRERIGTKIIVTRSKEGDNAETLLNQLGISKNSDQGKSLLQGIGNSEKVQLSTLGGDVGKFYTSVESLLTKQGQWSSSGGPSVPGYQNCAETSANLAFPNQSFSGDFYSGPDYIDSILGRQQNVSSDKLAVGDIIRYATRDNLGKHYASFAFKEDNGNLKVFSRSGQLGRLEFVDAKSLETTNYGSIRGMKKDPTGYYSRTMNRKK